MITARYAPDVPFPAYAFVPGRHPHPVSDTRGHSFGRPSLVTESLDPEFPMNCREFLFAIDLFNAGYYWEAHEAWENLWLKAGRVGELADFLKGLIKLSAAGVKAREGQPAGVQRHAQRAAELFRLTIARFGTNKHLYAGLRIDELTRFANSLATNPVIDETTSTDGLPVIPCRLKIINS